MKPEDVPAIYQASYDNADAAFALNIHDFPNFRKNLEKVGAVCLPRIDENPLRPRFRIGHIYEYAILSELTSYLSKETASNLVSWFFNAMKGKAPPISAAEFSAISNDGRDDDYSSKSSVGDVKNRLFVDYPWLVFSPDFTDRSEERQQNPLLWIFPPQGSHVSLAKLSTIGSEVNIIDIIRKFNLEIQSWYRNLVGSGRGFSIRDGEAFRTSLTFDAPDLLPTPISSVSIINITSLLQRIDQRLEIRLHTRQLRGE